MTPRARAAHPEARIEGMLGAIEGSIEPVECSPIYRLGLVVVATAMVILPLIYLSLIGLAAYGVFYHITHSYVNLDASGGTRGRFLVYFGPIAVGGILILFMVKPLFASQPRATRPRPLGRESEPLLFAFVQRICRAVHAPEPHRIDVDWQINASAGFEPGLLNLVRKRLALTIGLPLVGGLTQSQFAGILAHEFGHFSQGAGMRLTYVIRNINFWFARVVYDRDRWDVRLAQWSRQGTVGSMVVVWVSRGFVWLTRKILWLLMMAGHAISCFMLRQMEYDADRHEARLVGSETFEATCNQLRLLALASQGAHHDLQQSWQEKRLGDDLSGLILSQIPRIPSEVLERVRDESGKEKTGPFDTHPVDRDRVRSARAEQAPGILHLERPATELFDDFPALSREVTFDYYRSVLGDEVARENLVSTESFTGEQASRSREAAAAMRFTGEVIGALNTLPLPDGELAAPADPQEPMRDLVTSGRRIREKSQAARQSVAQLERAETEIVRAGQVIALCEAGFQRVKAEEFGMQRGDRNEADRMLVQGQERHGEALADLRDINREIATRLVTALRLLELPQVRAKVENGEGLLADARRFYKSLYRLSAVVKNVQALRRERATLDVLLAALEAHQESGEVRGRIEVSLSYAYRHLSAIRDGLGDEPYPFDHAQGEITMAAYAVGATLDQYDPNEIMHKSGDAVEKLLGLYFRLLGRLATTVEQVEAAVGANLDRARS